MISNNKGHFKYPCLGTYDQKREGLWFRERPPDLVDLHVRMKSLEVEWVAEMGDSGFVNTAMFDIQDEFDACCLRVEEILFDRGELKYGEPD